MPINYKLYPLNWKSEIRPSILMRAANKCERCFVENYSNILRGEQSGIKCYQTEDGKIYDEKTSQLIGSDYLGSVSSVNKFITVILTIAHLDHDIENNIPENLKAMCQKCHLNYDKDLHLANRKETIAGKRGLKSLL